MEVTLFMAMSLNGFIAHEDGNEDFISMISWQTFCQMAKSYGNYILGRKAHETVLSYTKKGYGYKDLTGAQGVIVSSNNTLGLEPNLIRSSSPQETLSLLKSKGYKKALLVGGSHLNSAFAKLNLIDNIILNIEPYIIGKGLPLFFTSDFEHKLKYVQTKTFDNGIIQMHYIVMK